MQRGFPAAPFVVRTPPAKADQGLISFHSMDIIFPWDSRGGRAQPGSQASWDRRRCRSAQCCAVDDGRRAFHEPVSAAVCSVIGSCSLCSYIYYLSIDRRRTSGVHHDHLNHGASLLRPEEVQRRCRARCLDAHQVVDLRNELSAPVSYRTSKTRAATNREKFSRATAA